MQSDELVSGLLEENRQISGIVLEKFSTLSFDDLNYQPDYYTWSAAECLDHLVVTNSQYIPLIGQELDRQETAENDGDSEFRSTFAGRFLIYSNDPSNTRKMKSPRLFRPEIKLYTKEVVKYFLDQNNIVYQLICRSKGINLSEMKMHSPVTRLLRFNIGEAFRIIHLHDRRHINQALKILSSR